MTHTPDSPSTSSSLLPLVGRLGTTAGILMLCAAAFELIWLKDHDLAQEIHRFVPEIVEVVLMITLVYHLKQYYDARTQTRHLMEELPRHAASRSSDRALEALEDMAARGWLNGKTALLSHKTIKRAKWQEAALFNADLTGIDLTESNLSHASLDTADLSRAVLQQADLSHASLVLANLTEAKLNGCKAVSAGMVKANLSGAELNNADFSGAVMTEAILNGARLIDVDFSGATLFGVDLRGADLSGAKLNGALMTTPEGEYHVLCNEQTMMPDGQPWTPETDIGRFVNSQHPKFWNSGKIIHLPL